MANHNNSSAHLSASTSTCTTQIELTLSCRNLPNADVFSKSDPYCIAFLKNPWQDQFYLLGRTETIADCLTPEWTTKFLVDFNFEWIQQIRFEVWDRDNNGKKDFLGLHECTMADIVTGATNRLYIRKLKGFQKSDSKNRGEIIIVTEEVSACKKVVMLDFRAEGLRRYFFFRPDVFLVISRSNGNDTYSVVFKTKTVKSSTCPHWEPFRLSLRSLCNGDYSRAIKVDAFKYRRNGNHKLIGTCFTSVNELANHANLSHISEPFISRETKVFRLVKHDAHPNSRSVTEPAFLILNRIALSNEITFLDYIKSGTQIYFAVSIDFSASNGLQTDPRSLHYIDTNHNTANPYEVALKSIGEIVAQYNTSGMYPSFGFGAKLASDQEVSHLFPLNFNSAHPFCVNIDEIITNYRKCLTSVTLHGPTHLAPVINNTAQIAARFANGKHYFVLLIVSNCAISDMQQTKHAIINASAYPLSIVIVGVGNVDFDQMVQLDSDDKVLSVDGVEAQRDIVQFVQLNKFLSPIISGVQSISDLQREVLAEIPEQMTSYMRLKGFVPEKLEKEWL